MDTASDRLQKYLAEARKIVRTTLDIDFDGDVWQLPYARKHRKSSKTLRWYGLSDGLTQLGKAIVANESLVNNGSGLIGSCTFPSMLRLLNQIVGDRDVTTLGRQDFDLAALALAEHQPPFRATTLSTSAGHFQELVRVCNLRGLTNSRIAWRNPFPMPDKGEREHLISPEVFKAFGEIRAAVMSSDDNDRDRLLVHAITLLICTGMRVGELLTLPADCWHEGIGEDDEGRIIKGYWLGYAPEKRGLTEDTFPRWVPTALVPIVQESVQEIRRITEPARENARALAEGRVNLPIDMDRSYTLWDAKILLGDPHYRSVLRVMRGLGAFAEPVERNLTKRVLGAHIAELVRRNSVLGPVMTDPFRLDLHEALFVVPQHFVNRAFSALLGTARALTPQQILGATKSQSKMKSFFERFDKRDPKTGKPYAFATHDPRHTLTTWQIKHGLDLVEVAAYFGRNVGRPERSNSYYDHMTQEERMALVDRALETGRFQGGWADAIARIKDPVKKDEMRHLLVGNVGYSQLGICSHPEGGSPPTTPEACSRCPGLLVIPGSQPHQKRSLEILAEIDERIATYESQVKGGVFMAGKWLDLEYERQARHRKVVEVLFSRPPLESDEEPTLVQMGNAKTKDC